MIIFPKMQGWLIYRVESGNTLTKIVRKVKDFTRITVSQIVAANPKIDDPDEINVGQRLRSRSRPERGSPADPSGAVPTDAVDDRCDGAEPCCRAGEQHRRADR